MLISRIYSVEGFGLYALIMALSRSLTSVIQMGYNQSIVHFISKFNIKYDWTNINNYFVNGLIRIITFGLIMSISLFVFKDDLIKLIFDNVENEIIFIILGIMLVFAINNYISATLRGLKLFKEQSIIFTSLYPLLMIVSIISLKFVSLKTVSINQFLFMGISLNLLSLIIISIVMISRFSSRSIDGLKKQSIKKLNEYSYPIWMSSLLKGAYMRSDRIMLGLFSSIQEVGIYSAGLTFSILFAFPLKTMGPVFQPLITEQYTKNDFTGMSTLYNTMVRWASLFVIPAFGGIICFGENIIQLFGQEFIIGYRIMIILSFAQIISTISGTAGTLLNMTGKQKSHTKIMTVGFIMTIILNILLIPKWGALGAAIGTSISMIFINSLRVKKVIKYFGIKTDYSTAIGLVIKCTFLVIIWMNLIEINRFHWIIMVLGYTILSGIIVYYSLYENEKLFLKRKIAETMNSNV